MDDHTEHLMNALFRRVWLYTGLVNALRKIAAFGDTGANEHLARTGSYALFDEPGAVQIAREALAKMEVEAINE